MSEKKQIDSLTPEQQAKIEVYREEFLKIGLSTEPTDRAKAEDALRRYTNYLKKTDETVDTNVSFIWADSPMAGAVIAAQVAKGDTNVTPEEIKEQASYASFGSFESYWVSTYAFIANELPVEKDELCSIAVDIVKECGVYWMFEGLYVVTPKPTKIEMADGKLHSTSGPALSYANGDGLYSFNGERKNSLVEVVLAERNKQA
jgi:hypothetical protein